MVVTFQNIPPFSNHDYGRRKWIQLEASATYLAHEIKKSLNFICPTKYALT